MEMYGKLKFVESYGNVWKCIEHLWKPMDMYGNVQKCIEMFGNEWKSLLLFFLQFFPFFVVWKMYEKSKEIYGKSMEMYGHVWKCMD